MVTKGATTMWELWNGDTADSLMNSHNHLMLTGDLQIWIYEYVLGIKSDPEDPGFKKIIIKPQIHPSLKWAKGHYDSMHGRIATNWKLQEDRLILDVTIPANTTATVYIPADDVDKIKEGGISASQAKGVNFLRMDKSEAVFMIGSGNYRFTSKIKKIDHLF
jgi:alpha-L-rhamnosidase